jgi:hypothetical protein
MFFAKAFHSRTYGRKELVVLFKLSAKPRVFFPQLRIVHAGLSVSRLQNAVVHRIASSDWLIE